MDARWFTRDVAELRLWRCIGVVAWSSVATFVTVRLQRRFSARVPPAIFDARLPLSRARRSMTDAYARDIDAGIRILHNRRCARWKRIRRITRVHGAGVRVRATAGGDGDGAVRTGERE